MTVIVVRQNESVVKVTPSPKPVVKANTVRGLPGSQGEQGPPGPQGPPGSPGSAAQSYTHTQGDPLSVWTINHNLGYRPGGVIVVDSGGTEVEGIVSHIDANTLTITFLSAFGGYAYLS